MRKIIKSIKVLELFPLSGTKLDDTLSINTDIRYVNSNNYMAFYRFIDDTIYVDRVIYGKRDYIRILFFE